jgi:2-polyprenyl-6-hydroxyphenyl methylase/3-demethylubiquinone-9 3-methyltransferase
MHEAGWKHQEYVWESSTNPQKKRLAVAALKLLGPPGAVRLLEYGCGNGSITQFFHSVGYRAEGIDISETVINMDREAYPHIKFQLVAPESSAPYPDGSFDAIYCSEVIEHVYSTNFTFSEFARLLRPGGVLILTTPYHGLVKNLVVVMFYFERHFNPTWQHIRFFTRRSLTRVCLEHGLIPKSWKHVGRCWPVARSLFVVCEKAGAAKTQQGTERQE